jgi:hypothetical protein
MERKKQLGNVAFGGDWSEQILTRERTQQAFSVLLQAVEDAADEDAGRDDVVAEVEYLCSRIARGELMLKSWQASARQFNQVERKKALARVLQTIRSGVGVSLS